MVRTMGLAFIALGMAAPVRAATADEMLLLCDGVAVGTAPQSETTAVVSNNSGDRATGVATTSTSVQVPVTIQVRIANGAGEMNVPTFLLPEMHGGKAGWFKIKQLVVGEAIISGKIQINFLTSGSFQIDRRTGLLTTGGFTGKCKAASLTERAF